MTVYDVVKEVCKARQMSQSDFAERVGVTAGNLSRAIRKNDGMDMKVSTLLAWLAEMDCEITVYDSEIDDEYYLDGESEDAWRFM